MGNRYNRLNLSLRAEITKISQSFMRQFSLHFNSHYSHNILHRRVSVTLRKHVHVIYIKFFTAVKKDNIQMKNCDAFFSYFLFKTLIVGTR